MSEIVFETEFKYEAILTNLATLMAETDTILEQFECPFKVQTQVDVSVDEVFTNICSYAYPSQTGSVSVLIKVYEKPKRIAISFIDEGVPYNPLEKEEPDITLSADERPIGGLGIFMVKRMMDEMDYEYSEGKNVLTLLKIIEKRCLFDTEFMKKAGGE